MSTLIPIYLTPIDAETFKTFQKHHAFINLLESLGVFSLKDGSVEIHFNHTGQIGKVDVHRHFRPQAVDKDTSQPAVSGV